MLHTAASRMSKTKAETVPKTMSKTVTETVNPSDDANIEMLMFQCRLSRNVVEYRCFRKEKDAFMEFTNIDSNLPKSFCVLLRASIDSLKAKGYRRVVQLVPQTDW